jgi:hypothetical protein
MQAFGSLLIQLSLTRLDDNLKLKYLEWLRHQRDQFLNSETQPSWMDRSTSQSERKLLKIILVDEYLLTCPPTDADPSNRIPADFP